MFSLAIAACCFAAEMQEEDKIDKASKAALQVESPTDAFVAAHVAAVNKSYQKIDSCTKVGAYSIALAIVIWPIGAALRRHAEQVAMAVLQAQKESEKTA